MLETLRVDVEEPLESAQKNERRGKRVPFGRSLLALGATAGAAGLLIATMGAPPQEGVVAERVYVAGIDVGAKDSDAARGALSELSQGWDDRPLLLSLDHRELRTTFGELGASLDVDSTLTAVLGVERQGGVHGLLRRLGRSRTDVPLVVSFDDANFHALLNEWSLALIDDPPFDGALELDSGVPVARLPKQGRRIDATELKARIAVAIARNASAAVSVPVLLVTPPISEAEVLQAYERAKLLLAGPITLTYTPREEDVELIKAENLAEEKRRKEAEEAEMWRLPQKKRRMKRQGRRLVDDPALGNNKPQELPVPEAVEVTFSQSDMLAALRARRLDNPVPHFEVELDEAEVQKKLAPVVMQLFNAARDARFDIDESGKINIVPSRPGTRVDTSRLVDTLVATAKTAERKGLLPVDRDAQPKFTTDAAEALGIKVLVAQYTTHHPCCQPRVRNIHRIADMIDGMIVKPGETFSVNAAVGPRTQARGFVLAPSIGDGEMVETPGGGVSQFATTLFNALFDAGYSIKERKAHSFYFQRYPVGIEATLSYPSPDLAFYNDSKSAVLIRCNYSETFIRVRLFGDVGTRRSERRVSGAFDFTEPRVEYEADQKRDPEKEKVLEHGSNGFSVTATRLLTLEDGTKRTEKRLIKYNARPRVLRVHPCKIPKGEKGHTGEKCPKKEEPEEPDGDSERKGKPKGQQLEGDVTGG